MRPLYRAVQRDTCTVRSQPVLQRKIKDNEYVCRAQHLGSYAQGHGHNQVTGQNHVSAITK